MSYLMRQGVRPTRLRCFLPNDDVYAEAVPGKVSLSAEMHKYVTPELTEQILDAGHNLDYVDAESILALGVIASGAGDAACDAPVAGSAGQAVGLCARRRQDHRRRRHAVAGAGLCRCPAHLGAGGGGVEGVVRRPGVRVVADDAAVGAALAKAALTPDFKVAAQAADVGFVRRKLADGDIYFIANTSNREVRTSATLRTPRKFGAWWNPHSGQAQPGQGKAIA
jgi:hypothetical protein